MGVKTALHSNQNPGGVFSIEDQSISTGNRYYVDSVTGASTYSGDNPNTPKATIAQAVALCTASKGDIIYVMPGHVETTTALDVNVAGIKIVGLGWGRLIPALTATTAATDLMIVSAANVEIQNIRLIGAASGVLSLIDIEGTDFVGRRIVQEHGAAPTTATLIGSGAHRFVLEDCIWRGTAAGPAIGITFEGKTNDWRIIRPRADYGGSAGLDTAFIKIDFKCKGYEIVDPIIVGFDTLTIDINSSSAAVGDGVVFGGTSIASTGITVANAIDAGGCVFINHFIGDTVAAKGLVIPTATPT